MKIYARISLLMLLSISCDAFFIHGGRGRNSVSLNINSSPNGRGESEGPGENGSNNSQDILGQIIEAKIKLLSLLKEGINNHFDRAEALLARLMNGEISIHAVLGFMKSSGDSASVDEPDFHEESNGEHQGSHSNGGGSFGDSNTGGYSGGGNAGGSFMGYSY